GVEPEHRIRAAELRYARDRQSGDDQPAHWHSDAAGWARDLLTAGSADTVGDSGRGGGAGEGRGNQSEEAPVNCRGEVRPLTGSAFGLRRDLAHRILKQGAASLVSSKPRSFHTGAIIVATNESTRGSAPSAARLSRIKA